MVMITQTNVIARGSEITINSAVLKATSTAFINIGHCILIEIDQCYNNYDVAYHIDFWKCKEVDCN